MVDAVSIALSGLNVQKQRLGVSANNIANMSTGGAVPENGQVSTVYRPLEVTAQSVTFENGEGAGVQASVSEKNNSYSVVYDPNSAYANAEGLVAAPNVDLAEEAVNLLMTKTAYKANIAVMKTADEMTQSLLDELV